MDNKTVRLPAEWEAQSGVMLTWPHHDSDWRPHLSTVEPVFADIAYHVSRFERLLLSGRDHPHLQHINELLLQRGVNLDMVSFHQIQANDTWARDHGPITVFENGHPVLLDFRFNGWGNKFDASLDNLISGKLHDAGAFKPTVAIRHIDFVLEGGSVESDGAGSLLTTSNCLLSPQRNPQLSAAEIETTLKELLGVSRVLWLNHGYLAGDDTDSHIDMLARLCDPQTIAYVTCDDPDDEHFDAMKIMETELFSFRTASGEPYQLVALPMPQAKLNHQGDRLPASYANFLILNEAVLVPTYDDPADEVALERIAGCFLDREIIGINCLPLILQYGSLHCVTMQLPQGLL